MAEGEFTKETVEMTDRQKRALRARNIALAIALAGFVVLLYFGTWAKLGANILQRPL
ncbi:MAG: hypothetical protein AAGA53_00905 [Pseudomonadota bacterium]